MEKRRKCSQEFKQEADIFDYIERFYNRHRRHSFSKGLAPGVYTEKISQTLN